VWSLDLERHEAPLERAVMKCTAIGLLQQVDEAEGSPISGTGVRAESSPDNAGMHQYCQMVRIRQATQDGVREEPALESPWLTDTSQS